MPRSVPLFPCTARLEHWSDEEEEEEEEEEDKEVKERVATTEHPRYLPDLILANPVTFIHAHLAESFLIPLMVLFPQPWTPSKGFPHPLAGKAYVMPRAPPHPPELESPTPSVQLATDADSRTVSDLTADDSDRSIEDDFDGDDGTQTTMYEDEEPRGFMAACLPHLSTKPHTPPLAHTGRPEQQLLPPPRETACNWSLENRLSYSVTEEVIWTGLECAINRLRCRNLGLQAASFGEGFAQVLHARRVPFAITASPLLMARPKDFASHVQLVGSCAAIQRDVKHRRDEHVVPRHEIAAAAAENTGIAHKITAIGAHTSIPTPMPEVPERVLLDAFLQDKNAADYSVALPPIFIGFGSMVPSPDVLKTGLSLLLQACAQLVPRRRVIVQAGWSELSLVTFQGLAVQAEYVAKMLHMADEEFTASSPSRGRQGSPARAAWRASDAILLRETYDHLSFFPQVAAVIHHGGAGTTCSGLRCGRPTWILPFFGDQPFWGSCVHAQGLGPAPMPLDTLTLQHASEALQYLLHADTVKAAAEIAQLLAQEDGISGAVDFFMGSLPKHQQLCPMSLLLGESSVGSLFCPVLDVQLCPEAAAVLCAPPTTTLLSSTNSDALASAPASVGLSGRMKSADGTWPRKKTRSRITYSSRDQPWDIYPVPASAASSGASDTQFKRLGGVGAGIADYVTGKFSSLQGCRMHPIREEPESAECKRQRDRIQETIHVKSLSLQVAAHANWLPNKPVGAIDGIVQGAVGFAKGLAGGVASLVMQPLQGMSHRGAYGFLDGAWGGLASFARQTSAGAEIAAGKISAGCTAASGDGEFANTSPCDPTPRGEATAKSGSGTGCVDRRSLQAQVPGQGALWRLGAALQLRDMHINALPAPIHMLESSALIHGNSNRVQPAPLPKPLALGTAHADFSPRLSPFHPLSTIISGQSFDSAPSTPAKSINSQTGAHSENVHSDCSTPATYHSCNDAGIDRNGLTAAASSAARICPGPTDVRLRPLSWQVASLVHRAISNELWDFGTFDQVPSNGAGNPNTQFASNTSSSARVGSHTNLHATVVGLPIANSGAATYADADRAWRTTSTTTTTFSADDETDGADGADGADGVSSARVGSHTNLHATVVGLPIANSGAATYADADRAWRTTSTTTTTFSADDETDGADGADGADGGDGGDNADSAGETRALAHTPSVPAHVFAAALLTLDCVSEAAPVHARVPPTAPARVRVSAEQIMKRVRAAPTPSDSPSSADAPLPSQPPLLADPGRNLSPAIIGRRLCAVLSSGRSHVCVADLVALLAQPPQWLRAEAELPADGL